MLFLTPSRWLSNIIIKTMLNGWIFWWRGEAPLRLKREVTAEGREDWNSHHCCFRVNTAVAISILKIPRNCYCLKLPSSSRTHIAPSLLPNEGGHEAKLLLPSPLPRSIIEASITTSQHQKSSPANRRKPTSASFSLASQPPCLPAIIQIAPPSHLSHVETAPENRFFILDRYLLRRRKPSQARSSFSFFDPFLVQGHAAAAFAISSSSS